MSYSFTLTMTSTCMYKCGLFADACSVLQRMPEPVRQLLTSAGLNARCDHVQAYSVRIMSHRDWRLCRFALSATAKTPTTLLNGCSLTLRFADARRYVVVVLSRLTMCGLGGLGLAPFAVVACFAQSRQEVFPKELVWVHPVFRHQGRKGASVCTSICACNYAWLDYYTHAQPLYTHFGPNQRFWYV